MGKCGKYLHRFVDKTLWEGYLSTYCGPDLGEMWAAGERMCDLFHQTAIEVARDLQLEYDLTEANNSRAFFDKVRQLPQDAKEIF